MLYGGIFDVENRRHRLEELEVTTQAPNFWEQAQVAQNTLKTIKSHQYWLALYQNLQQAFDDLQVLYEFYEQGEADEAEVEAQYQHTLAICEDAEFRSTLNAEEDALDAELEINAGAGGTEACDWVDMLMRMYIMWGEKNDYKVRTGWTVAGDVAGYKSVNLTIEGAFAYGNLKGENGVHRLVRISPFNAQGKRQTSFASVFVHPLIDDSIQIDLNMGDVRVDTFRASGAGGQHVNRTESAVRFTHIPTGIVVECQEDRSQIRNREIALKALKSRLYELEIKKRNEEKAKLESGKRKIEWGSQIRSYVLDDRRVKDHRTGHQTGNTDAVLNGELNPFIKAYLMSDLNTENTDNGDDD